MQKDLDKYDKELIANISDQKYWPKLQNADLIVELLRIADKQFLTKTIEGYLSSILIYQQILEEYLLNLLNLSNFYLQAEIWPTRLNLKIKDRLTLGQLIAEHSKTINFDKKAELLKACQEFNGIRIKFVHHLLKFTSNEQIQNEAKIIADKFYDITDLYWEARRYFTWLLRDLHQRVDWDKMV